MHQRLRPKRHRLSYRVFSALIDLDELPLLHERLRIFSHNRFNLFSFCDRDHGAGQDEALRSYVERHLAEGGLDDCAATIRLLCYPRLLGYVFNPLSVFFCYRESGELGAILYEVNNTFGERHGYLIPVVEPNAPRHRQACAKEFYVSPFNHVEGHYRFHVCPPGETVNLIVNLHDTEGLVLHAVFDGRRHDLSDQSLFFAFVRYPLMTVKVIVNIHWEALRLRLKGLRFVPQPPPPSEPVTQVKPS